MTAQYRVISVQFRSEDIEQLGTKEKFWFLFTHDDPFAWLFKYSRENTGEHWSEKAAEQICQDLGIPHVEYVLASCNGRPGIITKNVTPINGRLVMGNEVLHQHSPGEYPAPESDPVKYVRVREHTISRVLGCLDKTSVLPPLCDYDLGELNAGDVFCGYLMLDALVSNQDRHHENWAIIVDQVSQNRFLCPTYDHASSLGRELTDEERTKRLITKDSNQTVLAFVGKARSLLFKNKTDAKSLLTIEAFFLAVEKRPLARDYWLSKLKGFDEAAIHNIFSKFPSEVISDIAREFAVRMVLENRKRLLEYEL